MSQFDYIKDIAKFGLENNQGKLMSALNELIEYSKNSKKINFALQLQSILKDTVREQQNNILTKVGSDQSFSRLEDKEFNELILEKLTSEYTLENLIATKGVREELELLIKEHRSYEYLKSFDLPVSNKVLLYGPSGCGKTLASYVITGELKKMMVVVNLGAIVSSKLGDTSKNLSKIFRRAAMEDCIIFLDEFDTLGKVRDYNQDHGEMKRVVNTILQLFDYLPQSSMVIAATNQKDMLDGALLRRFDTSIQFNLPDEMHIKALIKLTLDKGKFDFDKPRSLQKIIKASIGLSYYSIQKTLVNAIKRSLLEQKGSIIQLKPVIHTKKWYELIVQEQYALSKELL